MPSLDEALRQFDAVEANLVKLEKVWARIEAQIPGGPDAIAFYGSSPEARAYDDLCRSFVEIRDALPAIDGWRMQDPPMSLDEIAQNRLDAKELDEVAVTLSNERGIYKPGDEVHEYRHRFNKKRRELVRRRLAELSMTIDQSLAHLRLEAASHTGHDKLKGSEWDNLTPLFEEIRRLLGGTVERKGRWNDLWRHLSFAEICDLNDISNLDWPSIKEDVKAGFFDETEPIPITVEDLGTLVAQKPTGPVTTALDWAKLNDDGFERLIFCILDDAAGYENPEWLMKTRAPDKGRDLSVTRVHHDSLSGPSRKRVIIQCKHWQAKSIAIEDVSTVSAQMRLWEPPMVDVLVVATSGRFTAEAVTWIEKRNLGPEVPKIEMWPESHLERLLAQRPHIVAEFGLR